MRSMPSATQTDALATTLRIVVTRLTRRLRREAGTSVSPTLLAALATIDRHGPITAGELGRHEQVAKPTITRTINVLVDDGLVERLPDPLDGRVVLLRPTPAGRATLRRWRRRADAFVADRLRSLTPRERCVLEEASALLDRITEGP
jgi:DNA-binding MarR family transcriptional regulator